MKHITARTTRDRTGVEVDVTRAAESLLDQVAALFALDPDGAEELLLRLGEAVRLRQTARTDGDDALADRADAQADSIREELLVEMAAAQVAAPITVRLSAIEAVELSDELSGSAAGAILPPARPVHEHDAAPLLFARDSTERAIPTIPGQRAGGAAA